MLAGMGWQQSHGHKYNVAKVPWYTSTAKNFTTALYRVHDHCKLSLLPVYSDCRILNAVIRWVGMSQATTAIFCLGLQYLAWVFGVQPQITPACVPQQSFINQSINQ